MRLLFLLFDREAEVSELLAERKILSVSKRGEMRAVKTELAVGVDQRLVDVDRDDVSKEHMVRAKLDNVGDSAFKRERTFCDKRAGDLARLFLIKTAFFEFIHLRARVNSAVVGGLYELCRGEIYRELASLFYELV